MNRFEKMFTYIMIVILYMVSIHRLLLWAFDSRTALFLSFILLLYMTVNYVVND